MNRPNDLSMLQKNKTEVDSGPPLSRIEKKPHHEFPLSFAQERIWFIEQLDPGNPVHNISAGLKFHGDLDIALLERCINKIIEHHEILRTRFVTNNDKPVQQVLSKLTIPILKVDYCSLNEDERDKEIQEYINEDVHDGFSLSVPPLIRFTLLLTQGNESILLITAHQIICDEISLQLLTREISEVYSCLMKNDNTEVLHSTIQYGDYSYWQRESVNDKFAQEQLEYWKTRLNGCPGIISLPIDRPRPAMQSFSGSTVKCQLDSSISTKLKFLFGIEDASISIGLLSAFSVLLYRYTSEDDILIGTAVPGRTQEQTKSLIGLLTNTIVIRTDFSANPTFRELLRHVRTECLQGYANQEIPFERLVEELQPKRTLSHSPLFQVMFSFKGKEPAVKSFGGVQLERLEIENTTEKFDLTLEVREEKEHLQFAWKYSTDLFERQSIEDMAKNFITLISSIIENFDHRVSELNLLTDEERLHLIHDLNQTEAQYPRNSRIEELFYETVNVSADSIAVVVGHERLTYNELDQKSNQLAHYLIRKGIGPGHVVGLFLNRAIELPIALLAILKSGACYLPIDPTILSEQVQYMLKDSHASMVLTRKSIAEKLETSCPKILIDSDWKSIQLEEMGRLPVQGNPTALACVIYTSGSTGTPKGVQVTHRNIVNHAFAIIKACGFNANDRMLQFASIAFDAASEELYPAWFIGARVILRNEQMLFSFVEFLKHVEKYKITVLNLPTLYWHELTQEIQNSSLRIPACVRILIIGGEKATFSTYNQWLQLTGETPYLFNTYGPTETTVTSTIFVSDKDRTIIETIQDVPIGRPISNTRIYILDQHLQLVPKGVPGELFIAGEGVTRGYLNKPELTASKFPIDHFSNKSGERFYRTGDIARYLPDGSVQFLGRIDNQVKIRGYRIELGEVEAALGLHEAVIDAVVTSQIVAGRKHLVGYIVARNDSLTPEMIKDFLKKKLPDYMIPYMYVFLQQFPMTTSGKVNRKALPIPRALDLQKTYIPPRNELEIQLAEIWENILNISNIGIHDNFFDLGGHSLLAVRLFTQIEKVTGKVLPLATLFQAPTIEQLANVMSEESWNALWSSLVPIRPNGNKPPFFCIHAIAGNVIGYQSLAQYLDPEQPVYGLQARGLDGNREPHLTIEEMAADYIRQIKSVQVEGPYHLGGHSSGGLIAFEMAQQLHTRGERVALLAMFNTESPGGIESDLGYEVWSAYSERIRYHLKHLASKDRGTYLKQQLKKLKRKLRRRISLASYRFNKVAGMSEPAAALRVEEACYHAIRNYSPRNYPGEITLFLASKRSIGEPIPPEVGWRYFADSVKVRPVPGDHLNIMKDPNVQVLAQSLQEYLDVSTKTKELQKVITMSILNFAYYDFLDWITLLFNHRFESWSVLATSLSLI